MAANATKESPVAELEFGTLSLDDLKTLATSSITELQKRRDEAAGLFQSIGNTAKEIAGTVGLTVAEEEEEEEPPVRRRGGPGRPRGSKNKGGDGGTPRMRQSRDGRPSFWVGTMDLLRRNGNKPMSRDTLAAKYCKQYSFKHSCKNETVWGNSFYVSGIQKAMKKGFVEHSGDGYTLTGKGMKEIERINEK